MTSDTARRLAEEKYPKKWTNSIDMTKADGAREGFLAGWDARAEITEEMVEAAARAMRDLWWPNGNPKIEASDPVLLEATRAALSAALGGEGR